MRPHEIVLLSSVFVMVLLSGCGRSLKISSCESGIRSPDGLCFVGSATEAAHIKYYGFYGTSYGDADTIPDFKGSVNIAVAGKFTDENPMQYVDWNAERGIHSIFPVWNIFWSPEAVSDQTQYSLADGYREKWNDFAAMAAPKVANGSLVAFQLYDEPYGNFAAAGFSRQHTYDQLQAAARVIKQSFPNTPIYVVEDRFNVDPQNSDSGNPDKMILFPPEIDWVAFDCYRGTFEFCAPDDPTPHGAVYYYNLLKSGLASNQRIVLVPQVGVVTDPNDFTSQPTNHDQNALIELNQKYFEFAKASPEVIAILGYTSKNKVNGGHPYWWGGLEETWGNLSNAIVRDTLLSIGREILFKNED